MKPSFLIALLCLLLLPAAMQAQEVPGVGHSRSGVSPSGELCRPLVGNSVADKKFWTVNTLLVGSTVYDVESTYYTLDKCQTCQEGNPLMRPFVKAGKPWLYAIQGSIDVGVVYTSYKMKKNNNKLWWLLPVAITATHSIAGTNNIRIAIRF